MNEVSVIVTNHTGLEDREIFARYKRRWEIECVFRELKDNFYFDQYQVRSLTGITRHWHLCFLAYTFFVQYEQRR
ncbi:MAG: transposase [bacterium]|nr:transposase [bacterium]